LGKRVVPAGKAVASLRDPSKAREEARAIPRKPPDCLKFAWPPAAPSGKIGSINPAFLPEACAMKIALQTYQQVADLVQRGEIDQARRLAVTIPIDHLRGLALLLVNDSRRL
jgi:hypothetical protein